MSGFIGTSATCLIFGLPGEYGNDDSIQPVYYRVLSFDGVPSSDVPRYSDMLWPRSSLIGQDYTNIAPIWDPIRQYWEWNWFPTGGHVLKKISGVTLDSAGAALGSAVVQLFNTTTGELVDTQTSDSTGNYVCGDPNAVTCFTVAYKAGSPDIAGTTKNNLVGS